MKTVINDICEEATAKLEKSLANFGINREVISDRVGGRLEAVAAGADFEARNQLAAFWGSDGSTLLSNLRAEAAKVVLEVISELISEVPGSAEIKKRLLSRHAGVDTTSQST